MFFRKQKSAGVEDRLEPASPAELPEATVVAAGTRVDGNIDCEGDLHVEGMVRGAVRALRLVIGPEGAIDGQVAADDITVRGFIKGPVHTRHIHLEADSTVEGDISTETIAIDTGARLSGAVWQEQEDAAEVISANGTANGAAAHDEDWQPENGDEPEFRPVSGIRPGLNGSAR